ncbi:MAG: selenium-dependent molybdenum cofactor biosynthesis protein YqeB [Actinomycetota bacterium]|nr:selenium-dependent molybdenum cofactor biosynthesis protein YqeB [Actinomycetota bacterium]
MIDFSDNLVVVRGGGDLGSGVIWRLRRVGFPVVVLELERPLTVRRTVAFSSAVDHGRIVIDGIEGIRVSSGEAALDATGRGVVPVLVSKSIPVLPAPLSILIDARLAKRALDTAIDQAPLVIGLGPGFVAGLDCDAVIETLRGHRLGRVIWDGPAAPNTGVPGEIGGASADRVLRAQVDGELRWDVSFGDLVEPGQLLGMIDDAPVEAKIGGTVRGLIQPGPVEIGLKVGDVDPRFDPSAIHQISDKALSIGGAVLEAVLVWLGDES